MTADPKNEEAVLERIRKLLALSDSSNPNEAAAALARAQKLMQMHGISDKELSLASVSEEECLLNKGLRRGRDAQMLGGIVAEAFGLDYFVDFKDSSSAQSIVLVGPKERLDPAAHALVFLQRQLKIAVQERRSKQREFYAMQFLKLLRSTVSEEFFMFEIQKYVKKIPTTHAEFRKMPSYYLFDCEKLINSYLNRDVRNYIEGWLSAVRNKVNAFAAMDDETTKLIEMYLDEHHPDITSYTRRSKSMTRSEYEIYSEGVRDGSEGFSLMHGVTGLSSPSLEHKQ